MAGAAFLTIVCLGGGSAVAAEQLIAIDAPPGMRGVAGCQIEPPVHVGVVRDRALDARCSTTLYFSRDFRKRYDKPALRISDACICGAAAVVGEPTVNIGA